MVFLIACWLASCADSAGSEEDDGGADTDTDVDSDSDDDIALLLLEHDDPGEAAQALVDAANDAGGRDNVTVVLLRYTEGS